MILNRSDLTGAHKSSYSDTGNTACVVVGVAEDGTVAAFDSKVDDGPAIGFTPAAWASFITDLRRPGSTLAGGYA